MAAADARDLTTPDGTRIRRWERAPADATEAVVFVHGATYAGRGAFDPAGYSWLEAVASSGRTAVAVDLRGYGDSERPPALDAPAEAGEPTVRASTAAGDVATVLDAVGADYGTVHLVGYSWGTIVSGVTVTERPVDVGSLTLYAPVYRPPADHREGFPAPEETPAYRRVSRADARERWADQRPDGAVPDDAFDAFWDACVGSGQATGDGAIVAPNGTLVDLRSAIDAPVYDPGAIDVPTLLVRGSLDTASTRPDALSLFDAVGHDDRSYVELAGGSHFMQFEPGRAALYAAVEGFHDRLAG